jgi:hypothetical protein
MFSIIHANIVNALHFSFRPIVTRGPPLSVEEWMRHVEEDGSINKVDELHKVIFRGVSSY